MDLRTLIYYLSFFGLELLAWVHLVLCSGSHKAEIELLAGKWVVLADIQGVLPRSTPIVSRIQFPIIVGLRTSAPRDSPSP
jgi:hypothetical protein